MSTRTVSLRMSGAATNAKGSEPRDDGCDIWSLADIEAGAHRSGEIPTAPCVPLSKSMSDEDVRRRANTVPKPKPAWTSADSFALTSTASDRTLTAWRRASISAEVKSTGAGEYRPANRRLSNIIGKGHRSLSSSASFGLEWIRKNEIYNVASTQLRNILQTPVMSLDLNGVPQGIFAGPLLEIFPDSSFIRPSRVDRAEWDEVMGIGKWPYPAEDSGLVTFWQAILVNVHWLRGGLGALDSLTSRAQSDYSAHAQSLLFDCVKYPMGQLVNAIGLSWEHHHVRNLKKMDEADRQRINIQSLSHRHHNLQSKIWAVLRKLQSLSVLKTQAERAQAVSDAHKKFEEFYVYLIYTIRIIMEDTLFLYRSSLSEEQMSCLGDANSLRSNFLDSDLIMQALVIIAGGTPISHWKTRFDYMGHGWLIRQTTLKLGLRRYRQVFLNPIKQALQAAEALKASRSSFDER